MLTLLVTLVVSTACMTTEHTVVAYYVPRGEGARKDGPTIGCIRQCGSDHPSASEGQLDCIRVCPGVATAENQRCNDLPESASAVCYERVTAYRKRDWVAIGGLIGAGVVLAILFIAANPMSAGAHK